MMSRAFSLAETLVAIGVLGALIGSVFGFMNGLAQRRDLLEQMTADARAAEALFMRIEEDVLTCMAGGAGPGAGITGDAQQLRLVSRSDLIDPAAPHDGAVVRASYSFSPGAGSVTMSRRGAGSAGSSELLSQRVRLLRFRYYEAGAWQDRFDSVQAGGLPVAIEVAIWFGAPPPQPELALPPDATEVAGREDIDRQIATELDLVDEPAGPQGEPDRVRVFIVPDGPSAGWEAGL
ncbi:MAG: type II secretion system protein J [Phycisphaerales bacterium JB039]